MVDQLPSVETCRACGAPIHEPRDLFNGLCQNCAAPQAAWSPPSQPSVVAYPAYGQYVAGQGWQAASPPDPDHPRWGAPTGIGVWLFSIVAMIVVQLVLILAWYLLDRSRGLPVPEPSNAEALKEWLMTPRLLMVQILYATLAAHLLTLAGCWAVVTKLRQQPFLASLGWHWAGRSPFYWLAVAVGIFIALFAADIVFEKFLPQSEPPFSEMLKKSHQLRIAIACLATFSAPFIEELVYRGVLYSGLRKRFGTVASVMAVIILFVGVHVPQYWGAWASIAGLTLLSLVLTVVRAKTKSLLPSIMIHFVNNFIVSVFIVAGIAG